MPAFIFLSQCIAVRARFLWLCNPAWKLTVKVFVHHFFFWTVCGTWLKHCWSCCWNKPRLKKLLWEVMQYQATLQWNWHHYKCKTTTENNNELWSKSSEEERERGNQTNEILLHATMWSETYSWNKRSRRRSVKFTPANTNLDIFLG